MCPVFYKRTSLSHSLPKILAIVSNYSHRQMCVEKKKINLSTSQHNLHFVAHCRVWNAVLEKAYM